MKEVYKNKTYFIRNKNMDFLDFSTCRKVLKAYMLLGGGRGDPPWPKIFVNKNAIKSEILTPPPAPDPPPPRKFWGRRPQKFSAFYSFFKQKHQFLVIKMSNLELKTPF